MSAFVFSLDQWPLVHQIIDGKQTDEDIDEFIRVWGEIMDRGDACATLTEVRQYSANPGHVKRLAEWAIQERERIGEQCIGNAFLVKTGTFRFVLSSFFLVTPMPYPFTVVQERDEAILWLRAEALKTGLKLPPDL